MTISAGQAIQPGQPYTYQDLARLFGVCAKTIAPWFARWPKFRPNKNTVRIPGSTVEKFIQDKMSTEPDAKKGRVKGKKCPVERA
jgi:hypothetical protein